MQVQYFINTIILHEKDHVVDLKRINSVPKYSYAKSGDRDDWVLLTAS